MNKTRKIGREWWNRMMFHVNGEEWYMSKFLVTPKMGVAEGERVSNGKVTFCCWYFHVIDDYRVEFVCPFETDDRQTLYRMSDYRYRMMREAAEERSYEDE